MRLLPTRDRLVWSEGRAMTAVLAVVVVVFAFFAVAVLATVGGGEA